jgi:hypothetical protein
MLCALTILLSIITPGTSLVDSPSRIPSRPSYLGNQVPLPSGMTGNLRAVWGGGEYLVVGDGPDGVLATRVDARGVVLDDPPLLIDQGKVRDVGFDGTNFLVVYIDAVGESADGTTLYARRLSSAGGELEALDASPTVISHADFQLSSWINDAAVSFGNGYYLVAWTRLYAGNYDVAAVRLTSAGAVAGQPVSMASRNYEESPCVAFDGRNFLLVWSSVTRVEGAFINPATGAAGEPIGISQPLDTSPSTFFDAFAPRLAWNGADYLVAWSIASDLGPLRIVGTRVNSDGEVVGGYPDAGGGFGLPGFQEVYSEDLLISTSWDGRDFVLGWLDGYAGSCQFDPCPPKEWRLLFSRVDSGGRLRESVPSELGHGLLNSQASHAPGESLFLYTSEGRAWLRIIINQPRSRAVRR